MNDKQRQVAVAMGLGLGITVLWIAVSINLNPLAFSQSLTTEARLTIGLCSALVPVLILGIAIGRLAKHRFFNADDIDGAGLTVASAEAKLLQALLQNTLEQTALAVPTYLAWALLMPGAWLSTVPMAATFHALGRLLFFFGYEKGAGHRALGFALTFYSTMVLLVIIAGRMAVNVMD